MISYRSTCAPSPFAEFATLHLAADLLNPLAVERVFALANFKAVVLRRIVAGGDLNAAVDIEMKQGKIEQRRRTNADDRKPAGPPTPCRQSPLRHKHPKSPGSRAPRSLACRPDRRWRCHAPCRAATQTPGQNRFRLGRECRIRETRRVHLFLRPEFCRAKRAARRIASFMLVSSALSLPAIS